MVVRSTVSVPSHIARSKALCTLSGTIGGYDGSAGIPSSFPALEFIANVTSITIPTNRGSAERRELNAANWGRIIEILPGLVDFEGLEMNNVVTYGATFAQACGLDASAAGGDNSFELDIQSFPMLFQIDLPTPNAALYPPRTLMLLPAWIKTNPINFSVEEKDDLRIVQTISLAVGRIRIV